MITAAEKNGAVKPQNICVNKRQQYENQCENDKGCPFVALKNIP
jgi:hypothetical protein